jgi:hypothetical protein
MKEQMMSGQWGDILGGVAFGQHSQLNALAQFNNQRREPETIGEALDARIMVVRRDLMLWEDIRKQLEEAGMLGATYSMLEALRRL